MANRVTIDETLCKGCNICTIACPKKNVRINREKFNARGYNPAAVINMESCVACGVCGLVCPDCAIKVEKELR